MHEHGLVVLAGAFLDPPEEPPSTMGMFTSRDADADYIGGDPFVLHGNVSSWHTRQWANMFAERPYPR